MSLMKKLTVTRIATKLVRIGHPMNQRWYVEQSICDLKDIQCTGYFM